MPSILLLTPDPDLSDKVSRIAAEFGLRFRVVAEAPAARRWIEMQRYDAFLIDIRTKHSRPLELLAEAWAENPVMLGALLDPLGSYEDRWIAAALGALVFSGPEWLDELSKSLPALPETLTLGEEQNFAVLVVEDLDSPRDILCAYVESLGYPTVKGAPTVEQALTLLREVPNDYFSIIADVHMPKKSGIDLLREVRADPLLENLPLIILTADPSSENLLACVEAGASGFLAKPPRKPDLRRELQKAKRMLRLGLSPRLCDPEHAPLLERALTDHGYSR